MCDFNKNEQEASGLETFFLSLSRPKNSGEYILNTFFGSLVARTSVGWKKRGEKKRVFN